MRWTNLCMFQLKILGFLGHQNNNNNIIIVIAQLIEKPFMMMATDLEDVRCVIAWMWLPCEQWCLVLCWGSETHTWGFGFVNGWMLVSWSQVCLPRLVFVRVSSHKNWAWWRLCVVIPVFHVDYRAPYVCFCQNTTYRRPLWEAGQMRQPDLGLQVSKTVN